MIGRSIAPFSHELPKPSYWTAFGIYEGVEQGTQPSLTQDNHQVCRANFSQRICVILRDILIDNHQAMMEPQNSEFRAVIKLFAIVSSNNLSSRSNPGDYYI